MTGEVTAEDVKVWAIDIGFPLVGITDVRSVGTWGAYNDWLENDYADGMAYLERRSEERRDVRQIMPAAESVIVLGTNYNHTESALFYNTESGRLARYALSEDYHPVLIERMEELIHRIRSATPSTSEFMSYVDTGPILERDFSARAGLGWIGKHTGLINRNVGSWLFLGEIITSLVLEVDRPTSAHCGSCERCLKACPTEAFVGPYELDARRCISYLTIENKDEIPRDLRPLIGGNVFGCDICQDVCPWNRKAETTTDEAFSPLPVVRDRDIASWLKMDSRVFKATFKNSSFERTKRRGFFRNIAVVLGNQGDPSAVPALVEALDDPEPLVRAHVAWALGRLGTLEALNAIRSRSQVENEPSVATELRLALEGSCQT